MKRKLTCAQVAGRVLRGQRWCLLVVRSIHIKMYPAEGPEKDAKNGQTGDKPKKRVKARSRKQTVDRSKVVGSRWSCFCLFFGRDPVWHRMVCQKINKKRQLWDRGFRRNSSLQLRGILRSRVLRVLCDLIKDPPHWGEQNLTSEELNECTKYVAVDMYATLFILFRRNAVCGNKKPCITRWIGQTITRNRTQNVSG